MALEDTFRDDSNINLHIVTLSPDILYSKTILDDGVTYHYLKRRPHYYWKNLLTEYRLEIGQIREIIEEVRPDIIQVFGTEDLYPLAALDSGVKSVVHMQGIITLYNRARGFHIDKNWLGWTLQGRIERKAVSLHRNFFVRTRLDSEFVRQHNKNPRLFFCWEILRKEFYITNTHRNEKKYLMFLGGPRLFKGYDHVLKIFEGVSDKLPSVELIVAGYSNPVVERERLMRRYPINFVNRIRFTGLLSPLEIREYFKDSIALLSCSKMENSSNAVCEAQISGVPVVAMDVGGISDLITDSKNGFLIKYGDVNTAISRILSLCANDQEFLRISENARQTALKRHDPISIKKRVINAYVEILEN
ncbi:MAG TPA: glycosyltransferase family 4 protein [Candidatus Nitrosotenuis sp.]|nr:glycosyltransferase family 4 protein [Candidatus Nitrosotenuis sp.]